MQDMVTGLRLLWRQKLQSMLLICGFAVFICLFHLTSQLAPSLFKATPNWVNAQHNFMTVGLKGHDGRMHRTHLANLAGVEHSPDVIALGYLGGHRADFRIGEQEFSGQALMLSNNLAELLDMPELTKNEHEFRDVVYVSQRFWQEHFSQHSAEQQLVAQTLWLGQEEYPLRVQAILPSVFNQVGAWQPDILLSASHLMVLNPINFGETAPSEEQLALVLEEVRQQQPVWYGIAQLRAGVQAKNIELRLGERETPANIQMISATGNLQPYVYQGIELQPDEHQALLGQWWLVLLLGVGFGLVNVLNLMTLSLNQLIKRSAEFRIRIAVGASGRVLVRQVLLEQLPFMVFSLLLGFVLSAFALPQWLEQFGLQLGLTLRLYLAATLVTVFVFSGLVAFSACLPLYQFFNSNYFSRESDGRNSPWQHRLALSNMTAQFFIAGLALSVTFAFVMNQWLQYRDIGVDKQVVEWHLQATDFSHDLGKAEEWLAELSMAGLTVALAEREFLRPLAFTQEIQLGTPDNKTGVSLNILHVTANYFHVLQVPLLAGTGLTKQSVVINEAAAFALGYEQAADAVGQQIFIENARFLLGFEDNEPLLITGVMANIPHFGLANNKAPLLYSELTKKSFYNSLSLLAPQPNHEQVKLWLQHKQKSDGHLWEYSEKGSLLEQLRAENHFMLRMVQLALLLGAIICVLAATSLYHQVGSHLSLMRRRYGVQLAVGALASNIALSVWRNLFFLLLIALLSLFSVLVLAQPWFLRELNVSLLNGSVVILALLSLIALSVVSAYLPVYRLITQPIVTLLRHEE